MLEETEKWSWKVLKSEINIHTNTLNVPFLSKILCYIIQNIFKERKSHLLSPHQKKRIARLTLCFTLILETDFVDKDRLGLNINLHLLNMLCFTEIPT